MNRQECIRLSNLFDVSLVTVWGWAKSDRPVIKNRMAALQASSRTVFEVPEDGFVEHLQINYGVALRDLARFYGYSFDTTSRIFRDTDRYLHRAWVMIDYYIAQLEEEHGRTESK